MPDITMCTNNECWLSPNCYRFKATPSHTQSYAKFEPSNINGKYCAFYIGNKLKELEGK
jgi:hypothetical protein